MVLINSVAIELLASSSDDIHVPTCLGPAALAGGRPSSSPSSPAAPYRTVHGDLAHGQLANEPDGLLLHRCTVTLRRRLP